MPIRLKQDKYQTVNLSRDLSEDDYVSSIGVIMGCSSFSAIGINRHGEYVGLFGHPGGGSVDDSELKKFISTIKEQGIRQLNIMDITLEKYTELRVSEPQRTRNVIQWANALMASDIIDGYKLSSKVSIHADAVRYTSSGIVAQAGCVPTAIKALPDIITGDTSQIDHLNNIKAIKPQRQANIDTPLLYNEYDQSDKEHQCCQCVIL
ncbi:hypothetical protein L3V83_00330 [Thiotrichales bacterium 19X7-9]|nr:hypothetical protein [Thiotrichales bacterium 19X7-9]